MSNYETSNNDSRMVTGLFRDRDSAERAYNSLADRGYSKDDVTLMMSDDTRKTHFADTDTELGSKAAEGAGIGAGIGGTIGAVLAGIAAVGTTLVLPGIGLVVAGPIAAALAGAGAGGVAGGLVGALIGAGIPEERVVHYEEGIKNGGILMGVTPRSDDDAAYVERSWSDSAGEHIIGTGIGAAGGAATGAAIGSVAGPVGTLAGAAIGGIAGGLAGKGAAEVVNPKSGDDLDEHHLAKGVGAGAGAATGAAIGAVGGPIGMAAGAAIGAFAGGAAGHAAGSVVNPQEEDAYWLAAHTSAPYYSSQYSYDDYAPAYQLGYNSRGRYVGQTFDSVENTLSDDWNRSKGASRLAWYDARSAARAAWDRVDANGAPR
ncbi:hypothetical protein [Massilia sp. DWR3-1-1]|uniref:hypothetical protein n=1 Tax=Massilia sp. DWR3-1-1 TaxID=2804559 RepID=UPI003CE9DD4D